MFNINHLCFVFCRGKFLKHFTAPLKSFGDCLRPNSVIETGAQGIESIIADQNIRYIDDSSIDSNSNKSTSRSNSSTSASRSNSSTSGYDDEVYPSTSIIECSLSSAASNVPHTSRAFSSDSGFVLL